MDQPKFPMSLSDLEELEKIPADAIVDLFEGCIGPAGMAAQEKAYSLGLGNAAAMMVAEAAHNAAIRGRSYEETRTSTIAFFGANRFDSDHVTNAKAAEVLFHVAAELFHALDLWPWEQQSGSGE